MPTTVSSDDGYFNEKFESITMEQFEKEKEQEDRRNKPVAVVQDRLTVAIAAHMAKCKGLGDKWTAGIIESDTQVFGHAGIHVISKCDQEPAIVKVQQEIQEKRSAGTVPRNSPAGDLASNSAVNKCINKVTCQVRTPMSA